MSLLEQVRKDKMKALKDKDTTKNGVCSLLISAIGLASKEAQKPLTLEEELEFVQREMKQTKEALAQTPESRKDLIDHNKLKISILESYLPQQMTSEELKAAAFDILAELSCEPIVKNKGTLIKEMMARYKGKTDGKSVNAIVAEILK